MTMLCLETSDVHACMINVVEHLKNEKLGTESGPDSLDSTTDIRESRLNNSS